jgi:hypothetical protein
MIEIVLPFSRFTVRCNDNYEQVEPLVWGHTIVLDDGREQPQALTITRHHRLADALPPEEEVVEWG